VIYQINRGQTKHSAIDRMLEYVEQKSMAEIVEGKALQGNV